MYRRWGTGRKHLVLQCVSVLSDRRQQWQELELSHPTSTREKFSRVNRSASNALTSRSSRKNTRRKIWCLSTIPQAVMKNRPTTETACDVGEIPSLQRRRIFSSEEFLASEEVFASTAEFCSVNFSLFSLLWNYGLPSPFVFFLYFCWHCCSFLWYWPVSTNTLFHDRS